MALNAVAAPQGVPEAPLWQYTVKPGDNLVRIAERYFIHPQAWAVVQQANKVADPHRIQPGTVLRIPATLLKKSPGHAVLSQLNGKVRWRQSNGDWQAATEGQKLTSGAELETPDAASAVLTLADGSRIVVSPGSTLILDTLTLYAGGLMADTRLRLPHGQTDIRANPQQRGNQNLNIRTPSAQAVVRGTEFRVAADETVTREETLAGLVGVAASGRQVAVAKGLGTLAKAGEAPLPPVALLPAAETGSLPKRFEFLPIRFAIPATQGAVGWQGDIAPDRSFERILLSRSTTGTALNYTDLPNGDYLLRLRAVDGNGLRGLDAYHAFTVFARPFPPGLNTPGNGATVRDIEARFAWGDVVDIPRYRLQIAATDDFASPLHDETLTGDAWRVPAELPAGALIWRAASIGSDGLQGPWSRPSRFTYKPGPGAADLGKAALAVESDTVLLSLDAPPEGLVYEAQIAASKDMASPLTQARSDNGAIQLTRPDAGTYFLGVRLVDPADNTPGPLSVQKIEIPSSRLWWLLLLLTLLAL